MNKGIFIKKYAMCSYEKDESFEFLVIALAIL
jgi:hypothetical protein